MRTPAQQILTAANPGEPALDMALTAALLQQVARGGFPDTVRVYRPGPTVAFGRMDRLKPGFGTACEIARRRGLTPLVRLGGGRAAAYGPDCVVVESIRKAGRIGEGLEERFAELSSLLMSVLGRLGFSVELGELPGEYCPGRFSLHLPGGPKVAGVAQRVVSGAALTTAVLVVDGGSALRELIAEIYAALELAVDPRTAGALTDRYPRASAAVVQQALIEQLGEEADVALVDPSPSVLELARTLVPEVEPRS